MRKPVSRYSMFDSVWIEKAQGVIWPEDKKKTVYTLLNGEKCGEGACVNDGSASHKKTGTKYMTSAIIFVSMLIIEGTEIRSTRMQCYQTD